MKYVLITGISSGIGCYLAKMISGEGFYVIGTYRKFTSLDPELIKNDKIHVVQMDLNVRESINLAMLEIREIVSDHGLFALINNAGIAQPGPVSHLSIEEIRQQFDVNFFGPVELIQQTYELLIKYGKGSRIVNISSVSGIIAAPFLGAYAASKFAIEGLSDSLRRELRLMDIKVIVLQPGPIKTAIWQKHLGVGEKFKESPYAEYMSKAKDLIFQMEQNAIDPEQLKPVVLKILTSPNPKARYLIHKNNFLFSLIAKFLPVPLLDYLIHRNLIAKQQKIRPF